MSKEVSCPHDPRTMLGKPIGMYHCPSCGAMVIAGTPHPTDEGVREQGLEPYPESTLDQRYLEKCEECGAITWHWIEDGSCCRKELHDENRER